MVKAAGFLKRMKQLAGLVGKGLQGYGNFIDKVGKVVSPIINHIPVVGGIGSYMLDRIPSVYQEGGRSLQNISEGRGVKTEAGNYLKHLNQTFPANPIGFGYNAATSLKQDGLNGVYNRFKPELAAIISAI